MPRYGAINNSGGNPLRSNKRSQKVICIRAAKQGDVGRYVEKEHTGYSPNRYYLDLRLRHARLLLLQTAMPVIDVAVAAGFVSHAHFSKCYRQLFDVTPTEERRRAF